MTATARRRVGSSGSGRPVLTQDQIDQAIAWVEARTKLVSQIATEFGVTESAIDNHLRKAGISRSGGKQLRVPPTEPRSYVRNGQLVRYFTADEDDQLRSLSVEGHTSAEIGRRMSRNPQTIQARLVALALHDDARESA